jgi:hypothetical protein
MFTRQFIKDIIQNHKDDPSKWEYENTYTSDDKLINRDHKIRVDLQDKATSIHSIRVNGKTLSGKELNFFERYFLSSYFYKVLYDTSEIQVPTKAKNPELFI